MVGGDLTEDLRLRCARWTDLKRWERREVARELRSFGLSYGEISGLVPAAKGTLSLWCRDIALDSEALARIEGLQIRGRQRAAMAQVGHRRHLARRAEIDGLRSAARAEASQHLNDPRWVAGLVAYWPRDRRHRTGWRSRTQTQP
jgi:hypothetical protein